MHAADRRTGASTTQAARTCQCRIRCAGGWYRLTRTAQVDAVRNAGSFTSRLMVTGQIGVDAEQLCDAGLRLGNAG
jgi:integrase/recombinase XerD